MTQIGHLSTHAFRHPYRSWLDAAKTPLSVQQELMRHTDIRTTMNIYGDVVTDEMSTASVKVVELAFHPAERKQSASPAKPLKRWWALADDFRTFMAESRPATVPELST